VIYPGTQRPRVQDAKAFFTTQVKPKLSAIYLPEQEEVVGEEFTNAKYLAANIQFAILLSL
jgi:hypothetical protein